MSDAEQHGGERRRIGRAVGMGAAGLLTLALALAWSQRMPIAQRVIDGELKRAGVAGRYRITRFGVGSQTLADVSLGDPKAPDLTARTATVHIAYRFGWPQVTAIEAAGVRLNARIVDGSVSMGAVDRLLPKSSGAAPELPDLDVALADGAIRLQTPAGLVTAALVGRGNLRSGFVGSADAQVPALAAGGCTARGVTAALAVRTEGGEIRLRGPVAARTAACAGWTVTAPTLALEAAVTRRFDGLRGGARLASGAVRGAAGSAQAVTGDVSYGGDMAEGRGNLALLVSGVAADAVSAAQLRLVSRFTLAAGRPGGEALMTAEGGRIARGALPRLAPRAANTPALPALTAFDAALARAGERFGARVLVGLADGQASLRTASLRATSGAVVTLDPAESGTLRIGRGIEGRLRASLSGGGLPTAQLIARVDGGAAEGVLTMAPYAVPGGGIALAPVRFGRDAAGTVRFATAFDIDGPLGDGAVQGLTLPVEGRVSGGGYAINAGCQPLGFRRLAIAGSVIGPSRLRLCPTGAAMLVPGGGAMRVNAVRLRGRAGRAPLTMEAGQLTVTLGRPGFVLDRLDVRLGEGADPTRLDVVRLDGRFDRTGVGGRFGQAGGKIGNVPLLLSGAEGDWRLAGGRLALAGALKVADAAAPARFEPLDGREVALSLEGGRIHATGRLVAPATDRRVADVVLDHDLSDGSGNAVLKVAALTFDEALQPEALTRLTLGVIANVRGTVTGEGRIRWTDRGVTSDGDFATDGTDLAAAFGPVRGIVTKIHFDDLLGLSTPPGQRATIAEVNTGIAVTAGEAGYQLLPDQKVRVEGARWPFSGGELVLEPTVLDFGRPVERRMTFRVTGMDAGEFIQQFDLKNISVTGTFDGTLPMVFDEHGGHIVNGRLAVRRGGGRLAYVGEVSNAALGMFGRLAFDALKSMRYDSLAIELDGALDGELVSRVLFDGTNETPKESVRGGLLGQLTGLPFRFRITIRAPFRGLLNSASSLNDPRGLIRQALPPRGALPGSGPVQGADSRVMP